MTLKAGKSMPRRDTMMMLLKLACSMKVMMMMATMVMMVTMMMMVMMMMTMMMMTMMAYTQNIHGGFTYR